MTITPADVKLFLHQLDEAIAASDSKVATVTMDRKIAILFKEFLHDFDPDMPPRPLCKLLGPLVGDMMMNTKLNRLDDIADKLGPTLILLAGSLTQLDAMLRRRGATDR